MKATEAFADRSLEDVEVIKTGSVQFVAIGRQAGGWLSLRVKHVSSDKTVSFSGHSILPWMLRQYREEAIEWVRQNASVSELLGR